MMGQKIPGTRVSTDDTLRVIDGSKLGVASGPQFNAPLSVDFSTGTDHPAATVGKFDSYEFGIAWKQAGATKDNRLELYLGSTDSSAAELSVRNNGNGTGAIIQARDAGDTDGLFLDFTNATYPFVRWGNAGPYAVKNDAGQLIFRNVNTPSEAQLIGVANTFTPGDVREYVTLGVQSTNRFSLRVNGFGGGVQRPLDIDASAIQFQIGGALQWTVDATGLFCAGGTTASYPALKRSGAVIQCRLADDSANAGFSARYVVTPGVTVSALPSASTAGVGARAFVTDASATTFASTVSGGGSNSVPVYSDGSVWKIG